MIKVIHVISDMKIGGAGIWLLNLLKYTDKAALQVEVIVPRGSMLKQEIEALGFGVVELDGMADKSLDLGIIGKMTRIFNTKQPHIVHTHAALSARVAARLAGVKAIIHTKHCLDLPKTGIKKSINSVINCLLSDKVIAVSEAARKSLIDSGVSSESIETIYGSVEELKELTSVEKTQLRNELGIKEEDLVIGIVARLVALKGHRYLLKAFKEILGKHSNVKLLVVGAGPIEAELKAYTDELEISGSVVFTGFRPDVDRIANIIDISVLPSLTEALSLSLIEAMSLGKPCVGTDVGGIPEVIISGENGYIVPPGDPESLAESILKLIEDEELRSAMGNIGRQYVKEKFSVQLMAERIEALYGKCLKGRG